MRTHERFAQAGSWFAALALVCVSVIALAAPTRGREDRRVRENRRMRSGAPALAFFEAFPVSGRGTTSACSTTAPTGAKGEILTFTRASSGTCTRTAAGGLATTGIADGDLVVLSTNVARTEYDSAGTLGLLVEAARTNVLLRYIELANAAWADVGTPALVGSLADPFGGTAGVSIEDNDGAASEGRSQSVTVTAATAYFMHCYVKAGTRAEATISIDGTTQTITGLSATTWSIVEKADASSSGVSIPIQVLVGDAVGDTGTVIWGGCQVEAGTYRTSIIPTTSAAVTRAAESASFTVASLAIASMAGSWQGPPRINAVAWAAGDATNGLFSQLQNTTSTNACIYKVGGVSKALNATGTVNPATAVNRTSCSADGTTLTSCLNSTCATAANAFVVPSVTSIRPGNYFSATFEIDAINTRLCADSAEARCR